MTKADLNQEIGKRVKVTPAEISAIIEALFELIKQEIAKGNKITFKRFGTFKTKKRAAKKVQLIKQKKTIDLESYYMPTFLPSESFSNR